MKNIFLTIISALICGVTLTSCGSDKAELPNEGAFSGTYTVTYLSSDPDANGSITINLKNGKYTCIGIPHDQADISGNYTIKSDKITFEINVWKTNYIDKNGNIIAFDFDIFIIPQGECHYTFDGNKLKLSKVCDNFARYEWNLEKK